MKVYKNGNAFYMEDNGNVTELAPNKDYYLKLPTNSVNRVWVSCGKVDKAPNQCIDYGEEVKVARTITPGNRGERKGLEEYLSEEDKAIYLELIAKAKKAKEEANKKQPMTDLEKAQRAYERAKAKVEALSK